MKNNVNNEGIKNTLDEGHWIFKNYRQRCTRKEAQSILLINRTVTFQGHVMDLSVKHIGAGVYEIFKTEMEGK